MPDSIHWLYECEDRKKKFFSNKRRVYFTNGIYSESIWIYWSDWCRCVKNIPNHFRQLICLRQCLCVWMCVFGVFPLLILWNNEKYSHAHARAQIISMSIEWVNDVYIKYENARQLVCWNKIFLFWLFKYMDIKIKPKLKRKFYISSWDFSIAIPSIVPQRRHRIVIVIVADGNICFAWYIL